MSAMIIELSGRRGFQPVSRGMPDGEESAACELRRARRRIAQLERNLTMAMRDSLDNYNRARAAERRLAEATTESA